ncbi:signal peptidase I [Nocardioides sp. MH1]|uniref:signal peptidase I n=1 Tax=Nocardioides sp. MH1 TaxID=3242490 RepID=UPI003522EEE9
MSRVRGVLLTIGAVVGSLCLVVALAGQVLGVRPLLFRSGSMSPDIPAGAFGLARPVPAGDLGVGDVVSVVAHDGTRVTHRVVGVAGSGATRRLTLQGDTNPTPDDEVYEVTRADRVFWSMPYAGYAVAFIGSPLGLFLLGGFVFAMLVVILRRDRPRGGRRRATALVAAPLAVAVVAGATTGTTAAYSDTGAVPSGTLTARTVARPDPTACAVTGNSLSGFTATITWPVQTSPATMTYTATLREGNALTVTASAGTAQTKVTSGLLGSLLGTTVHVDITAALPGTSWTSAVRTRALVVGLAGLTLTCGSDS